MREQAQRGRTLITRRRGPRVTASQSEKGLLRRSRGVEEPSINSAQGEIPRTPPQEAPAHEQEPHVDDPRLPPGSACGKFSS